VNGVAVIQTAFPGDVILTGGLLRSVRAQWPELPLLFVVRPDTRDLARLCLSDLSVTVFDKRGEHAGGKGLRLLASELARGPWDAALIPHRSLRSALLARQAGFRFRVGFALGGGNLLHSVRVPYRRGVHEIERNHDLLCALQTHVERAEGDRTGPPAPLLPPRLVPGEDGEGEVRALLGDETGPAPIVLAPGSVWPTKRWPEDSWVALAGIVAREGSPVIWIGGPEDRDLTGTLAERSGIGLSAAGHLSWIGTAALLARARVLVANDSAPVHLAGALRCPVVTLFGPTVPGFGFGPIGTGSCSLGLRLGCRPCRLHGSRSCPEGHFRCLRGLEPGEVARAVCQAVETAGRGITSGTPRPSPA